MNNSEVQLHRLAQYIEKAKSVSILSGAGISTESGIPDFRSTGGFWTKGMSREQLMSLRYLQSNPKAFWEAYKDIFKIKLMNDFQPNYGHRFLVELEKMGKEVTIITQNVDGLHIKSGSSAVYEAHGSIHSAVCPKCQTTYDLDYINEHAFPQCRAVIEKEKVCNHYITVNQFNRNYGFVVCEECESKHTLVPDQEFVRCKGKKKTTYQCNSYLKPGVVLFGDAIKHFNEGVAAVKKSNLFLVLGSSLQVGPINQLVTYGNPSTKKVIINRDPTELDGYFDEVIHAGIGDTFKKVFELITEIQI